MRETVERAKIKAALAAKKLSLNEMAKQDDYIHSEGLNISNKMTKTSSGQKKKRKNDHLRTPSNAESSYDENNQYPGTIFQSPTVTTILPNASIMNDNDCQYDVHDDDSVESFDKEYDPILQMVKSKKSDVHLPSIARNIHTSNKMSLDQSLNNNSNNGSKKDPNRFMADLDARIATPDSSLNQISSSIQVDYNCNAEEMVKSTTNENTDNNNNNNSTIRNDRSEPYNTYFQSFTNADDKLHWLRNVASPKIQKSLNNAIKQVPGGNNFGFHNSSYNSIHPNKEDNDIEMMTKTKQNIRTANGESIDVISSSSLAFGDAENAELQRLNRLMKASNTNPLIIGLELLEKNRYYLFIFVTFLVTIFVYFYIKKKTDEIVT
jgi:hypothetical protein